MKKLNFIKTSFIVTTLFCFHSCQIAITPKIVNQTLPTLTKSKLITPTDINEYLDSNKCKYITKDRNYVTPAGLTSKSDLKIGAKGIDEWVELDKGNAYVLTNYKWVTVDNSGLTQLYLDFDTVICKE